VEGLARRASYLKQIRHDMGRVLLVDTGNTLTGPSSAEDTRADSPLVGAMTEMGYDAVNTEHSEFQAAPSLLRQLAHPGQPVLIASNAQMASVSNTAGSEGAQPRRFLVLRISGIRVGLVGVMSPGAASEQPGMVEPPVAALRSLLPEVGREADVIIVLADLSPSEVQALLDARLDIQVVLACRAIVNSDVSLSHVGQTLLATNTGEGPYIGRLTLEINADGQITSYEGGSELLDSKTPEDPALKRLLAQY